jgi:fumarylacetoacetase
LIAMNQLDATHDPARKSWVATANAADTDFPIQNLPFGVFRCAAQRARGGVAIGDRILDLAAAHQAGLFSGLAAEAAQAASAPVLNDLMAMGPRPAAALREQLSELLRVDGSDRARVERQADRLLVPMADARLDLPAAIGDYTDFLCSIFHTRRMGRGNLPPSYQHQPVAYHGRASSIRIGGETIVRPKGEYRLDNGEVRFGPEPSLDFELELAVFVARGNELGKPISIADASDHIFGYCLLNDWSARGLQRWESQPLGPFLGKSFSTTISPWIVTPEALAPFRAPGFTRDPGDPGPLPHLSLDADRETGGLDLVLDAYLRTPAMRASGAAAARVTRTNATALYWTFAQMVAHHTVNGCNLRPGDLLASGTESGPTDESRACIAELNGNGTTPLALPGGESRLWLEDGDEVTFRGRTARPGHVSIGFGDCHGRIAPAVAGR